EQRGVPADPRPVPAYSTRGEQRCPGRSSRTEEPRPRRDEPEGGRDLGAQRAPSAKLSEAQNPSQSPSSRCSGAARRWWTAPGPVGLAAPLAFGLDLRQALDRQVLGVLGGLDLHEGVRRLVDEREEAGLPGGEEAGRRASVESDDGSRAARPEHLEAHGAAR